MSIKERIILLIEALQLSPAEFAEKINIQRSGLSHIYSGRNKPSLDFIEKTLNTFPEINVEWILLDKGEMFKPDTPLPHSTQHNKKESTTDIINSIPNLYENSPDTYQKNIEKIVLLYKDGSFKEYSSEK